jgi:aryl-alcohol dehydrogenase-like predicted oxidoreductase
MSLGWVASRPGITSPIIGARKPQDLEESVAALETPLSEDVVAAIDEIVPPGSHVLNYYTADFGPNVRPFA